MTRGSSFAIVIRIEDPRWRAVKDLRRTVRKAAVMTLAAQSNTKERDPPLVGGLKNAMHFSGRGKATDLRGKPPPRKFRSAKFSTLPRGEGHDTLSILLTNDRQLQTLNKTFRGKDKATNVLSFPAAGDGSYLGDIAIAFEVARKEAREARKPFANHVIHLAVHGVLHLLGYDHGTEREAKVMEPLEVAVLDKLGIADPYRRGQNVA